MTSPVQTFKAVETVEHILDALENTVFNGFPVINSKNRLIGLINRNTLITLVDKCCFYSFEEEQDNDKDIRPSIESKLLPGIREISGTINSAMRNEIRKAE